MSLFTTILGTNLGFDAKAVISSPLTNVKTTAAALIPGISNAVKPSSIDGSTTYVSAADTTPVYIDGVTMQPSSVTVAPNLGGVVSAADSTVVNIPGITDGDIVVNAGSNDMRIRLRAGKTTSSIAQVLGAKDKTNILSILYETEGMLFPYTPAISVSQAVNWDPIALIQNNYDVNAYQRTPSVNISVTGTFTTQTQREGEYLMAVLHFLRTVTKSYFGEIDREAGKAGTPPPVLYFDGYGDFMFRYIPVVVKSYSYAFDESVDSNVFTAKNGMRAKLPAKMTITMELGMQMNMNRQRKEFSLDKFRTGELMTSSVSSGGWF
jgi:hypothetical protein